MAAGSVQAPQRVSTGGTQLGRVADHQVLICDLRARVAWKQHVMEACSAACDCMWCADGGLRGTQHPDAGAQARLRHRNSAVDLAMTS